MSPHPQPVEPSRWQLDAEGADPDDDLVGVGADLEPGTLLQAYAAGLFPMGLGEGGAGPMGWWSPVRRGVLLAGEVRISRSLRRSLRRFEIRVDTAFDETVEACADPAREGSWITPEIKAAYGRLFSLGWAHSVEVWADGQLAGGLYGVGIGGFFAGESMFHRVTDASKAAVVALHHLVHGPDGSVPGRLIDVQWQTPHLASLGVSEIGRQEYLARLHRAVSLAPPLQWTEAPPPW